MADDTSPPTPAPFVGSGPNGQITEGEARALLDELADSGLTLREFTLARGLKPQRLSWWKSHLAGKHPPRTARRPRAKSSRPAPTPRFVPLVVQAPSLTRRTAPTAAAVPAPRGAYELALGNALTRDPRKRPDTVTRPLIQLVHAGGSPRCTLDTAARVC